MSSKSQLTDESLIRLLEKERCNFTDRYRPLLTAQEVALQKANSLIAEPPESLKRNYSKKKANNILNDIKNCISYDVFVLCALVANPSALGAAKLGDYVSTVGRWWEGANHPKGLTMVSERYGMTTSKIPALVQGVYQDILKDGQHANQSDSGAEGPLMTSNIDSETPGRDIEQPLSTGKSTTGLTGDVYKLTPDSAPAIPESSPGLTGDVYGLTTTDAPAIIDEIQGQMWLTDPYDDNTQPFVTIQISWKLRDQIILQRPKMM